MTNSGIVHVKDETGNQYWYNAQGKLIREKDFCGNVYEYDDDNGTIKYENTSGLEIWYNKDGLATSYKDESDIVHNDESGYEIKYDYTKGCFAAVKAKGYQLFCTGND